MPTTLAVSNADSVSPRVEPGLTSPATPCRRTSLVGALGHPIVVALATAPAKSESGVEPLGVGVVHVHLKLYRHPAVGRFAQQLGDHGRPGALTLLSRQYLDAGDLSPSGGTYHPEPAGRLAIHFDRITAAVRICRTRYSVRRMREISSRA